MLDPTPCALFQDHAEPMSQDPSSSLYLVVINFERQYSLWPAERAVPAGWRPVGPSRSRHQCLEYIRETWTDMTPASLLPGAS